MICGRLPSFIASLPDSVGSCTFIIIRMLALLMLEATDRREADTSERRGAAHQLADETRPGLPASATRHPSSEPTPPTQHASSRPASPPARPHQSLDPPRSCAMAAGPNPLMRLGVWLLGLGTGSPAVARPGGGEVEEGVDERVVGVGVPDQTGSDVRAVAQRERDHARMCQTVGHPGGQGADGPTGGDDLDAIFGGCDVIVGAGRGAATLLVQRPERGP